MQMENEITRGLNGTEEIIFFLVNDLEDSLMRLVTSFIFCPFYSGKCFMFLMFRFLWLFLFVYSFFFFCFIRDYFHGNDLL